MAPKYRRINLKFWTDLKVRSLDPMDKFVFLYLITNPHSHLSGIYGIPMMYLEHETGLDSNGAKRAIDGLIDQKLIQYDWKYQVVWVVNMLNYQVINDSTMIAVKDQLDSLHECPLIKAFTKRYHTLLAKWGTQCRQPGDKEKDQDQEKDQKEYKKKDKEEDCKEEERISLFDQFWSCYPRKIGKGAAKKAWEKLKPDLETVLLAIEAQKQSPAWQKEGGQFIPHPATWLNQERWADSVEIEKPEVAVA